MDRYGYMIIAVIFTLISGCGGSGSNQKRSIRASDAYVVNANVTIGTSLAAEDIVKGAGWYSVCGSTEGSFITVVGGVNDINVTNGIADKGEPYAPALQAPFEYQNVTPFTTRLLQEGGNITKMAIYYPVAYQYGSDFDFDVVLASKENLDLSKENTKAAIELSYPKTGKSALLRIINGLKVHPDDDRWRFIVWLKRVKHGCGGSLIAPDWVLTAAHCLDNEFTGDVLSGTYSLDIGGEIVKADQVIRHPAYSGSPIHDNDIGLIHLAHPVTSVKPIYLNYKVLQENTPTIVAGWGSTLNDGSNTSKDLLWTTAPIIDFDDCNYSYRDLTGNMICAGYMDGSHDSCHGDSGGPLMYKSGDGWRLAGIVSSGGTKAQMCGAPNYPGIYTEVSNYTDWIESYTGSSSSSSSSSSIPQLDVIFDEIDGAQTQEELDEIVIRYMTWFNGSYGE